MSASLVRPSVAMIAVLATVGSSCGVLGGDARDCTALPGDLVAPVASFADDFEGTGPLDGYVTNNPDVLPDVGQVDGRYRAVLDDNTDDKTLHFWDAQGRLDAKAVAFPFEYIARNIGIGTVADSQQPAPPDGAESYVFAGVQVHDLRLEERNSSHIVVGHRGGTTFTIEGKNTCDGESFVDDDGPGVLPEARADIRIVGNADRTLTVWYQAPNPAPGATADEWILYRGTGTLPGTAPEYGEVVYVGIITYAQGEAGLPFVGTVDSIDVGP